VRPANRASRRKRIQNGQEIRLHEESGHPRIQLLLGTTVWGTSISVIELAITGAVGNLVKIEKPAETADYRSLIYFRFRPQAEVNDSHIHAQAMPYFGAYI